ncbi:hypothetical protein M569_04235, partial [Genlisea aurea]
LSLYFSNFVFVCREIDLVFLVARNCINFFETKTGRDASIYTFLYRLILMILMFIIYVYCRKYFCARPGQQNLQIKDFYVSL